MAIKVSEIGKRKLNRATATRFDRKRYSKEGILMRIYTTNSLMNYRINIGTRTRILICERRECNVELLKLLN